MPALKYYNSTTSVWEEASTVGPAGPRGRTGATGPTGPAGSLDQAAADELYVNLAGDTMTGPLALAADPVAPLEASTQQYADALRIGRNRIINGDFSVNQRGAIDGSCVGQNRFGYDRWVATAAGVPDSCWYHLPAAAPGELPESATSFARIATAGQVGDGDYAILLQSIEGVRTLSGKQATLSFWAKTASGTQKVAFEFQQAFGNGGSPSPIVMMGVDFVTPTTSWARYSITFDVPSIAGKTIGTVGDDRAVVLFWTSGGSTYADRASNIGLQNGTVDIWGVQLEEGSVATPYEDKPFIEEWRACRRYYQRYGAVGGFVDTGHAGYVFLCPPDFYQLRAQPTATCASVQNAHSGAIAMVNPACTVTLASGEFYLTIAPAGIAGTWVRCQDVILSADL